VVRSPDLMQSKSCHGRSSRRIIRNAYVIVTSIKMKIPVGIHHIQLTNTANKMNTVVTPANNTMSLILSIPCSSVFGRDPGDFVTFSCVLLTEGGIPSPFMS